MTLMLNYKAIIATTLGKLNRYICMAPMRKLIL